MDKRALLTGAVFLLIGQAVAQPLEQAVEEGLRTNPALAAQAAQIDAAAEAVAQAKAAGRPRVELAGRSSYGTGTFDPGDDIATAFDGLTSENMGGGASLNPASLLGAEGGRVSNQAELSITQPVFTGFRILNGIREAEASVAGAQARLERSRQLYAFQIVDAYLKVVSAEAEIGAVRKSVESLTQAARAAQVGFEAGQSTRTDVAIAQSRLSAVEAQLAAAQAQAISARQTFAVLGGEDVVEFSLPDRGLDVPSDIDAALALALTSHPELRAAALDRKATDAALKGARAGRSPQVQVRGAASYAEGQFFENDMSENYSVAAELSVPLFEGGAIRSRVRQARAEERAARFAETDIQRQVTANVRSAWSSYRAAEQSALAATKGLEAAELAWRGVQLEREVGQRSVLDVLRVEEDLLDAQVADVDARAQVIRASWQVALATGSL